MRDNKRMLFSLFFVIGLGGLLIVSMLSKPDEVEVVMQDEQSVIPFELTKWAVVPKWDHPPKIDGQLAEAVWQQGAELSEFRTAFYYERTEYEASYRVGYDEQFLYISGLLDEREAETLSHIEWVVRPAEADETHVVVKLPVSDSVSPELLTVWNPVMNNINFFGDQGRIEVEAAEIALSRTDGGLQLEAAVRLDEIDPKGVNEGVEWAANVVHVHQLYTQPINAWVPLGNSEHWHVGGSSARIYGDLAVEDRFGSLFFHAWPKHLSEPSLETEVVKVWSGARLNYRGFNEKELILPMDELGVRAENVTLHWKAPGGKWQAAEANEYRREGSTHVITFSHADPVKDGIYRLLLRIADAQSGKEKAALLTIDREHMIAAGIAFQESLLEQKTQENLSENKALQGKEHQPLKIVEWAEPSEEAKQLMAMIPPQPGFRFVGLPELPELYPENMYRLSADGQQLTATRTGTAYPNQQFAETSELTVSNGKGEKVKIPYYLDQEGRKFSISAHLWYLQKDEAIDRTLLMAKLDPLGAARVLYAFAKAYVGYNPTVDRVGGDNHINHSQSKTSGPPFAYWGGVWNRWWYNDLTSLRPLMTAYAYVKRTNAFELLSEETGIDVDTYVVEKMFKPSAEFVKTYVHRYSNMSFQPWRGMAALGKVIDDPDLIHYVVENVERFVSSLFLSDGFWQEVTLSYHNQTVGGLNNLAKELQGWSDPPGYISPRTGKRFDNLDLSKEYPIVARALQVGRNLAYADGKVLPIMDTWASEKAVESPTEGPILLPGAKVGRLAGGEGTAQSQIYLSFHPKYGHNHLDPLNLNIYAKRQELVPDLGYTHNSFYRHFSTSTMAHNTVIVDSSNMQVNDVSRHGGNIETFAASDLAQVMRAGYDTAYAVTDEYSRELWYIPFAGGRSDQAYVIDLFRVSGGSRHEYTLQGAANQDAVFTTELPLSQYGDYLLPPGTTVVEPKHNSDPGSADGHYPGYIYVRDVKQAELDDDKYEITLETGSERTGPGSSMRMIGLLVDGGHELYLGRSPSLRSIRVSGKSMDNNDEAVKYTMPKMVLRREGADLKSRFITIMEPYYVEEGSRIEAAELLSLDQGSSGAVAVKVTYGDTVDIIISNPHHPEQPVIAGGAALHGSVGMIRLQNGEVAEMMMVGGKRLEFGEAVLAGDAKAEGSVRETKRIAAGDTIDALVTDVRVPEEAAGQYVIVTHPDQRTTGYQIREVRHEQGSSVLVLADQDPGFEILDDGTSEQLFYPNTKWSGDHKFEILFMHSSKIQ